MFNREKDVKIMDFKKEQRKQKFYKKLNDIKRILYENKEMVVFFTPIVVSSTVWLTKTISKNIILGKEKNLKELYCYDRSLGHYWSLKRTLTNKEWVEIDKRKNNGERLADILDELKVLK